MVIITDDNLEELEALLHDLLAKVGQPLTKNGVALLRARINVMLDKIKVTAPRMEPKP